MLPIKRSTNLSIFDDIFGEDFDLLVEDIFKPIKRSGAFYVYDEEKNEYMITVQVPGFKKEDIEIRVDSAGIILEGEVTDESMKNRISKNKFSHILRKSGINEKSIEAVLEDGILTVKFKTVDNKEEEMKKIEIKGG